jgi:hypothetical protein
MVLVCAAASADAQQVDTGSTERPTVTATRLGEADRVQMDGVLDESAWARAGLISSFTQSDPQNGAPATERTEIRILFDEDRLYIGADFFDSNPSALLGNQMVRDGSLDADDRFIWVLDPLYSQTNGYYFEVNPAGAMGDAQLVTATSNVGTTQNRAWDGIWMARVRRHDRGWTAEIEIPFRTLNFDPRQQAWGANFQRTVRRKNEESFWSSWGYTQGIYSLDTAGRIEGLTNISQGLGLDVKPYAIGSYTQASGTPATADGNAGLDLLYSVTPQLKANLTINTDFAQTEVDDRQVNLTRFPLFFPEKRDFFLEGSGNFDFSSEPRNDLTAFFTRRIGIDANGQPQKIDYGAKVGGQVGNFNVGLMQLRTASEGTAPGEDFFVVRPKRRFFSQSYVGLIYTNRSTRESAIPDRHSVGVDFQLATSQFLGNRNLVVAGHYIKTPDGTPAGENTAWGLRFNYPNDRWRLQLNTRWFDKNFNPAIGFAERVNHRKYSGVLEFAPRPNNRWLRQVGGRIFPELFTDTDGQWVERSYQIQILQLDFQSGDTARVNLNPVYSKLQDDFRIGPGLTLPVGSEYNYTRYGFNVTTANRRMISGNVSHSGGTFFSGDRKDYSASINVRPRPGLLVTMTASHNHIELPEGSLTTRVLRGIVNTQFSPFMSLANNIQYDSVSRLLGWQLRYRWILEPGNDLYFVWFQNWQNTGREFATLSRSATVKAIYTRGF